MNAFRKLKTFLIPFSISVLFVLIFTDNAFAQVNYNLAKQYEKLCTEIYETTKLYELQGRWDEAIELLNTGIKLAQEEEGNKRSEALLKSQLGNLYRQQRKFDEALSVLLDAKQLAESVNDQKIVGDCLFTIGYVHDHKELFGGEGDYKLAKDYYSQSLALRETIGDERGIGFSLFRLGRLSEVLGNEEEALPYYDRAQKIAEKNDFKILADYIYTHQGGYSESKGDLDEALKKFQQVLEINIETGFNISLPFSYMHLGRINYKKGNIKKGREYYLQSIAAAEDIKIGRTIPWGFWSIANMYFNEAEYDSALHYYEKTVSIAEEFGIKNYQVYESYNNIGLTHLKKEDYNNSIDALNLALPIIEKNGEVTLLRQNRTYLSLAYTGAGKYHEALTAALMNLKDIDDSGDETEKGRTYLAIAVALAEINSAGQDLGSVLSYISAITKLKQTPDDYFESAIQHSINSNDDKVLVPALYEYGKYLASSANKELAAEKFKRALEISDEQNLVYEKKKIYKLCNELGIEL